MSENSKNVEQHGCIVCGKVYTLLVIRSPGGQLVDCTVTSPGGRRVPDDVRPLVACEKHPESQIETALARHYPGQDLKAPDED